jgi:hypothetical protein
MWPVAVQNVHSNMVNPECVNEVSQVTCGYMKCTLQGKKDDPFWLHLYSYGYQEIDPYHKVTQM